MSNKFLKPGDVCTYTSPNGGVTVDVPVLIGSMLVVPLTTVAQTFPFEGAVTGVFTGMPKASGQSWAEGALLYWDNTAKNFTTTATANTRVGSAAAAAQSADTTGVVRLDGIAVGGAAP